MCTRKRTIQFRPPAWTPSCPNPAPRLLDLEAVKRPSNLQRRRQHGTALPGKLRQGAGHCLLISTGSVEALQGRSSQLRPATTKHNRSCNNLKNPQVPPPAKKNERPNFQRSQQSKRRDATTNQLKVQALGISEHGQSFWSVQENQGRHC